MLNNVLFWHKYTHEDVCATYLLRNSVIDHALLQATPDIEHTLFQFIDVMSFRLIVWSPPQDRRISSPFSPIWTLRRTSLMSCRTSNVSVLSSNVFLYLTQPSHRHDHSADLGHNCSEFWSINQIKPTSFSEYFKTILSASLYVSKRGAYW